MSAKERKVTQVHKRPQKSAKGLKSAKGASNAKIANNQICQDEKRQPKDKVWGQDDLGTSGTHTSGYPWPWPCDDPKKKFMQGAFSVVLDRPGCPAIWVQTSRHQTNFMQENLGLIFRSPVWELPNSKSGLRLSLCTFCSLLPMKQLFCLQLSPPKTYVSSIRMSFSPKVLDLNGCFSSEKPFYYGDSLDKWKGPQWAGPSAVARNSHTKCPFACDLSKKGPDRESVI